MSNVFTVIYCGFQHFVVCKCDFFHYGGKSTWPDFFIFSFDMFINVRGLVMQSKCVVSNSFFKCLLLTVKYGREIYSELLKTIVAKTRYDN